MDTNSPQTSATIYDFADFAARFRSERRRRADDRVDTVEADLPRATFGSAWYHEEAMQDLPGRRRH